VTIATLKALRGPGESYCDVIPSAGGELTAGIGQRQSGRRRPVANERPRALLLAGAGQSAERRAPRGYIARRGLIAR
jgi:hypothetical protein